MKFGIVMFILSGGSWYQMDVPLKVYDREDFCIEDVEVANNNKRLTGRGLNEYLFFECLPETDWGSR